MDQKGKEPLTNCVPYQLFYEGDTAFCRWLFLGECRFTEPFFEETISKCRGEVPTQYHCEWVSALDVMAQRAASVETVAPSAIVFHVSRCGSTLVSQLLALFRRNIMLSEVPFFDEILRKGKGGEATFLKAAVAFYGQRRSGEANLFIKTDSWHVFYYELLRSLYPGIPFILLYRRPDEVIRSQQKRRGMQAVPGLIDPELFGFTKNERENLSLDEYMAKVLETYFKSFAAILQKDPLAVPVNYNEGALSIVKKIAFASGVSFTREDLAQMEERACYDAKYPDRLFTEEPKADALPLYCREAFNRYEELEMIRKQIGWPQQE